MTMYVDLCALFFVGKWVFFIIDFYFYLEEDKFLLHVVYRNTSPCYQYWLVTGRDTELNFTIELK